MERARSLFASPFRWWKKQRTRTKLLAGGAVVVLLLILLKGSKETLTVETVKRQDLVRSVAATGTVVSTTDLALSFQQTNLVRSILVTVGDTVRRGQILATLSNASEVAAVQSARGALLAAQAREKKTLEGTGGDELRSAEIAFENARRKLYSDGLVAEERSQDQVSTPPIISGSYNGIEPGEYRISFDTLNKTSFRLTGLEKGKGDVDDSPELLGTKGLMIRFPTDDYSFDDEWIVRIPNREGVNYVSNLNAYNEALAALNLKKTVAPSDIEAARADVVSAEGSLASAQAAFEKTVVRAPADGTVTKLDIKLGQLAEAFVPVVTIQDVGNLYIEANVNESNISFVKEGQPVTVTYDALVRDLPFQTTVTLVDLGATIVDGIVNYKLKALVPNPEAVRPGMTANLSIQTAFVPGALVIPDRVITTEGTEKSVLVVTDEEKGKTEKRVITTGLRGDGGLVEVLSGLTEGERVLFVSS